MTHILLPKRLFGATLAGLLALSLPASAADFNLRLAHHYPDVHIQAGPIRAFVEEVEQNSQGRIAFTVYPAETLVSGREVLEAVEGGVVDMAPMPGNYQSGSIPQLDYFTYPFMFDNAEHFHRAVNGGLRELLAAEYARRGITLLNYYHKGALHFMHRSQFLNTPESYQGQRIRSLGPTISALISAMGGNALSVPLGEVDAAIERGVVDAITTNCAAHLSRGWSRGLPFVTFLDLSQGGEGLAINSEVMEGLPEDLQEVIRVAARNMEDSEWSQMIHEDEDVCLQRWAEAGVSVHRLTDEERAALVAIARPILDAALAANPEVQTYVDIAEATPVSTMDQPPKSFVERLAAALQMVAGLVILITALAVTANALARYTVSRDISLITEFGGFVFLVVIFLGLAGTFLAGSHVSVELLSVIAPERFAKWFEAVAIPILSLVFTTVLMVVSALMTLRYLNSGRITIGFYPLPYWLLMSVVPLGSLVLDLVLLRLVIQRLRGR